MIFNSFTEKANKSVNHAANVAMTLGHTYIGSEHLLAGLLKEMSSVAFQILINKNVTYREIETKLIENIGKGVKTKLASDDFTPRSRRILERALLFAKQTEQAYVGTEHILIALLEEESSFAVRFLKELKVDLDELREDCQLAYNGGVKSRTSRIGQDTVKPKKSGTPALDKYGVNLTKKAASFALDPVIARDKEIQKVMQILSRRTKNNPCLIGEPGVGKTAIIEGLAQEILSGNVPDSIAEKSVVSLDLTSMVAGAKYRGDFEDRLKNVVKELSKNKDIILFIDEIHTIIGAGAAEGAIDAANILKPYLARGEVQLIGATTLDEYRKHIEKDSALERRFQPVTVDEPGIEATKVILQGLKNKYEVHHKVEISQETIDSAVALSTRYINDRFLPDKAIDLIDEAAAKLRLGTSAPSDEIREQIEGLKHLEEEKAKAINEQDFELAANIRDTEREQEKQLEMMKETWGKENYVKTLKLEPKHIEDIVSEWTKIPLQQLQHEEQEKLIKMEEIIHKKIVGQASAVSAVAKAIRRGRAGLKDPKRPIGSFLFLGPTGVGKTQLSKTIADILFGSEESLIRVDMSEYMEKHAVSKLIGSPPGYVGYDQGGQLTEKIRRKPYAVVLFDEIEKAHPDVLNTLLQVLDDGVLTDATGRKVDFKNTVIIMTSNVGAKEILSSNQQLLGFNQNQERGNLDIEKTVMREVKKMFRPEFLNRIDEIIVFEQLGSKEIKLICKNMVEEVLGRLRKMGIRAKASNRVIDSILKEEFDKNYGARTLKRAITTRIEDMLSEEILQRNIKKGDDIFITPKGDKFVALKEKMHS